jgi:uncharacterized protein
LLFWGHGTENRALEIPEGGNVILGQTHFIKSVEDMYEAIVNTVPQMKFGVAFNEASGPCLTRVDGNDEALQAMARVMRHALAAGHAFSWSMRDGYPINVLGRIKDVPEVCSIFCATANPVQVVVAESEQGRGILGVIDGFPPKGLETDGRRRSGATISCARSATSGELAGPKLRAGVVIPAHPLALTSARKLDERRQRALTRYYLAAGAGGVAVGVHTTQFQIRDPRCGLFAPVLELASGGTARCGRGEGRGHRGPATPQAVREAELAARHGYDLRAC